MPTHSALLAGASPARPAASVSTDCTGGKTLAILQASCMILFALSSLLLASPVTAQEIAETPYNHPLAAAAPASDGSIPGLDILDGPGGERYAVYTRARASASGTFERTHGVRGLAARPWSAEERLAFTRRKLAKVGPPAPHGTTQVIGDGLAAALTAAGPGDALPVIVRLERPQGERFYATLERQAVREGVETRREWEYLRQRLLTERLAVISAAQGAAVDLVERGRGKVLYRPRNIPALLVAATPATIGELSIFPGVVRMDYQPKVPTVEPWVQAPSGINPIGALTILKATQLRQFVDLGMDGEYGQDDLHVAILEPGTFEDDHLGFNEDDGPESRIAGRYTCGNGGCEETLDFPQPEWEDDDGWDRLEHATAVAGLVMGDLQDDQDALVHIPISQLDFSGYANEARGYLYHAATGLGFLAAVDHIIGRSPMPSVVNVSMGFLEEELDCSGESAYSQTVNDFFEHGILSIHAGSNEGHADPDDCTVAPPGSAIGAFTVGGTGNYGSFDAIIGDEATVRGAEIYDSSPRGGTDVEGKGRSIIDIVSFAYRAKLFGSDDYHHNEMGGTSFATPTVAAAALDYIDFFKQRHDDSIDDPGVLFANLLLFGDRTSENGALIQEGFDPLWGGGRMETRLWDDEGMDGPSLWESSWLCVDDATTYEIAIDDGAHLPAEVDALKAVIFWYDRRHEVGTAIDDIDLELVNDNNVSLGWSASFDDNKERVYSDSVAGESLKLLVQGVSVTGDDPECGAGSRKVYYVFYYEDEARDDQVGAGPEIWPG